MMTHTPVLPKEVLEYLDPKPNEHFVDGTVGQAGHTLLILEKNAPNGKVIGIDQDVLQIENAKEITKDFNDRVILVNDSYAHIKEVVEAREMPSVDGILLDLGYSSWHLEESQKGFSFQKDEVLDMRYNQANPKTAATIVNEYPEKELARILQEYGEEKFARKIAKKIVEERKRLTAVGGKKIESTFQLCQVIEKAVGKHAGGGIHYATRTFQALRIAVNDELQTLEKALPDALSVLSPGGRLVVISFHSLEDRIVKHFIKEKEQLGLVTMLTPKPIVASGLEVAQNPRSRSAKLRAMVKK